MNQATRSSPVSSLGAMLTPAAEMLGFDARLRAGSRGTDGSIIVEASRMLVCR